jgi:predicted RNase H-like nuclease (RuvC/YqgF family)
MFKFVNELSNEIEDLDKLISDLRDEASQYEGQGTNIDVLRKRHLKELEEKLSRAENKSEQYEFKYHDSLKLINSLTVHIIHKTIELDRDVVQYCRMRQDFGKGDRWLSWSLRYKYDDLLGHHRRQGQPNPPGLLGHSLVKVS